MTPKEKAKELVEKFLYLVRGADRYNYNLESMNIFIAKKCAAIAAIEVFNELDYSNKNAVIFWSEVKTEIENF